MSLKSESENKARLVMKEIMLKAIQSNNIDKMYKKSIFKTNYNALMFAVYLDDYENAKLIIDKGANVNIINSNGDVALSMAFSNRNINIIKLLLDNGANVNQQLYYDETVLFEAVDYNEIELIKLLLNYGANVNQQNIDGETVLFKTTNIDIIKLFIENGANVNILNVDKQNPLMYIIQKKGLNVNNRMYDIVQLYIDNGININQLDIINNNIMLVIFEKDTRVSSKFIKLLINYGINVNQKNTFGFTPLVYAIKDDNIDNINILLDAGADVDFYNPPMKTSKNILRITNNEKVYRLLILANSANITHLDKNGDNILSSIIKTDMSLTTKLTIIDIIIENVKPPLLQDIINQQNMWGKTPLHYAVIVDDLDIVKLLTTYNANPNILDNNNKPPLYYSKNKDITTILKYITSNQIYTTHTKNIIKTSPNYITSYRLQIPEIQMGVQIEKFKPSIQFLEEQTFYIQNLDRVDKEILQFYSYQGDRLMNAYLRNSLDKNKAKKTLIENKKVLTLYFITNNIIPENITDIQLLNILTDFISRITRIMSNAPKLDKDIVVYRGQTTETNNFNSLGLLSTTIDYSMAQQFGEYINHIILPKGGECLWMESISEYPGEKEILLPFRICFNVVKINPKENLLIYKNSYIDCAESATPMVWVEYKSILD